jgi:hypothetical protein
MEGIVYIYILKGFLDSKVIVRFIYYLCFKENGESMVYT